MSSFRFCLPGRIFTSFSFLKNKIALCGPWRVLLGFYRACKRSSVVPPGPGARDQGKQWQWPELVVYTPLAEEAGCRSLFNGRSWLQTHV